MRPENGWAPEGWGRIRSLSADEDLSEGEGLGVLAFSEASLGLVCGLEDGAGWWPSPVPAGRDHTVLEERARPARVLGGDAPLAPGHARVREASLPCGRGGTRRCLSLPAGPTRTFQPEMVLQAARLWHSALCFENRRWAPQDGSLQPRWWRRLTSAPPCPLPYMTDHPLPGALRTSQGSPHPRPDSFPPSQELAVCGKDRMNMKSVLVAN